MDISELQELSHRHAVEKGFWDDVDRPEDATSDEVRPPTIGEKLALVHSEVSEALEDYRRAPTLEALTETRIESSGKPVGFPTELADIVIRVADIAEKLGIDLEQEILVKMAYNNTRPLKHGGRNI